MKSLDLKLTGLIEFYDKNDKFFAIVENSKILHIVNTDFDFKIPHFIREFGLRTSARNLSLPSCIKFFTTIGLNEYEKVNKEIKKEMKIAHEYYSGQDFREQRKRGKIKMIDNDQFKYIETELIEGSNIDVKVKEEYKYFS